MDVTPRKRTKIVTLHEHTSSTYREIAKIVGVSLATVSRVIKLKHDTGSVTPKRKGKCGRKKKTTPRDDAYLIRQSKKDPRKTSDALNTDLKQKGIEISSSTVRRRLLAVGRRARRPVKKQLLTKAMKEKRYKWAKKYKDWTKEQWRKVIFSDGSHFFVQGQRSQHVRRSSGEKIRDSHIDQCVKHPLKKMFWGCFSYYGVGSLHPVEGMMRSAQYIDVLQKRLVPELEKRFPDGSGIFQQDLAPCHTSKIVKNFMTEKNIQVLDWPGNSPDVSPIENLWAICKSRLRTMDCTTKEMLIQALIQMSEKLQDNPFAALFSSVKDAEQFSQQHLPSKTQPPTSKEQVHKSENDNTVSFLEHLLLVTTRGEWPHTAPRVLLPSTDPLTVDSFPLLLFTRLLLDPSDIELVGPQGEGGDEAAQSEVVVYLSEVFSRCWATRDRPGHIARKVMEAVVTNLATALEQPELYPSQKVEQQMLRVLQQGLGREGAVEDLARNLVTHISKERAAAPPRVFEQLLAEVTTKLGSCSLMAVDFSLIEILEFYATLPLLAPLLTRIPPEQETRMGRSFHKTPLGSLLSISSLPDHAGLPSPFFDKPSSKPGHIHKDTEKSIWLAQRNINIRIHKIFYKLLKVSSQAKDGLLSWLESCLQANRGRAGIWHLQGIEGGLQSIYASDGFMINLGAVMLQLAQPFTQDVKTAKILKVDPTYCKARPMREEGGVPGAYTKGFENLSTLVPHSEEDSVLPHSQQYSFISSCFFLTHRALHLGMQVAQQKLSKLSQELGRLHQNEAVAEVMQPYVEARTADLLSLKAALFEPHLTESLLQFLGSTTEWMVQISLSPTNQLTPPTTLKEVTLPLPDEEEEMPHPFLQCIPEFLVENLTEAISSVRHYTAGLLDAAGDSAILSQLMSFIVVFMGSSKRMSNPHLRAQLASCLEILLPESKNSSGGLLIGLQEQLFQSHPLSSQLVSTLLNVFVSIEMTGQNVAFEEKFGYRRPMYEVMKYLWELPHHRQKFTELATEALSNMESARPPLFLRFVNLLINDAIYLLDEGLSYMSQLRESQKERDGGEWDSLTPAQRESRERSFQNMMLLARFHNNLGSHTIQILIRLTKEIPQMFTHSTLVDRMAAMLNYFLSTLVGPKQRNLKVRYMEKYEFRPGEMVSDICTIYTHLFANSSFCLAVSSDGRSYTPQLFSQASDVLCRVGRGLLAEEMQEVGHAVVAAGKAQAEDDDIAAEAPEEFLDPIMSHLMTDPVILPSSKLTVDRQTIARHLLSDQIDPFNRQPLTMEEVVPNTELKIRITQWLEEKRTQRAALSQIPKPQ